MSVGILVEGRNRSADRRVKAALITLVVAGVSLPLTSLIWPAEVPAGAPAPAQALAFGLLLAECLAMGGGVAFLILGYPAVKSLPVSPRLTLAAYAGVGYYLVNWWTHDHLHAIAGTVAFNRWLWMTIAIEYVFHGGMMVFGAVLALFFARILQAVRGDQGLPGSTPLTNGGDPSVSRLRTRWTFATIAVGIGIISIPTSLAVFRPVLPGGASLPAAAMPFFIGMKIYEGLALGTGLAFLLFGFRLLRRAAGSRTLAVLAYLSIGWYLVNWWLHDNLHAINGDDLWGLLRIEYEFHITLMLAAGVLAVFFLRLRRSS